MQPRANTASTSDEKSQNVQAHAGLSKNLAGSVLDRIDANGGEGRLVRPLLSVRQAAKFLGVCHATVYRLCVRGKLPHFRVSNAVRIDVADLKAFLAAAGRGHLPRDPSLSKRPKRQGTRRASERPSQP